MNIESRPRFTRGAHDPKAHAYNVVGLFSEIIAILAYVGRTLNDTMCDHADPDICDRCQRKLHTLGTLISGSASAVASWSPARLAELNARLAIAAARRLADTIELGHPMAWAMKGGSVLTTVRRAINAAAALLDNPDLGALNHAQNAATECTELDLSTSRIARKQGLEQESFIIGHLLKAASKAAWSAVAATETGWVQAGETRQLRLGLAVEGHAGAAVGAALDAAALLDIDPGRAEAMMVVATGIVAEFDRRARPADDAAEIALVESVPLNVAELSKALGYTPSVPCEKSTSQKANPRVSCDCGQSPCAVYTVDAPISLGGPAEVHFPAEAEPAALPAWLETPTEEYDVLDDFEESTIGDVADDAIAEIHQAEEVLRKVANEHRTVQSWWRADERGVPVEYRRDCCVSCRDAAGRPMPAPCRTAVLVSSYYVER